MILFLKLKHWQLFLIWILIEFAFIATIRTPLWIIGILLFGFSIIGWIYTIGKVLSKMTIKDKIENYKEDLWISIYLISLIPFGLYLRNPNITSQVYNIMIFVAGILGFVSLIKLIYFAAKSLKQIESKTKLKFADYSNEFLLILFFIIGIWVIQPRLNKIINNAHTTNR